MAPPDMVLLWIIFVLSHFSVAFGQNNCGKARVDFPAPVFGDGENLSAEGCGIWDQRISDNAPWRVHIKRPDGYGCRSTLISPTTVLAYNCPITSGKYEKSESKDDFKVELGKCAESSDYNTCVRNGQGQIVKIRSLTQVNALGSPKPFHIWKIEKAALKENFITPVCMHNQGNLRDFDRLQQYTAFNVIWDKVDQSSVKLSEDFSPCLNQSKNINTCDKVHENFFCARLKREEFYFYHYYHLIHQENHRHFLRAFLVEEIRSRDKFYYDILPLLDQIVSASVDIPMMPRIPPAKKRNVFKNGQSYPGCGVPTFSRNRRTATDFMVRGKNALKYAHPWHVAMLNGNIGYFCGGTLISTTVVLTAAHCVFDTDRKVLHPQEFEFVFGTIEMKDFLGTSNTDKQKIYPSRVIPHPEYDRLTKEHDLAVVVLEKPVLITAAVKPICLWQEDYSLDQVVQRKGKVVGWGRTLNQTVSEILQEAELSIIPYYECFLKDKIFFTRYLKPTRNFCAGENGVTACIGDSGGGFYMNRGTTWYLRGIVSFGAAVNATIDGKLEKTCEGKIPSLYLDVTNYMAWIVENSNLIEQVATP